MHREGLAGCTYGGSNDEGALICQNPSPLNPEHFPGFTLFLNKGKGEGLTVANLEAGSEETLE